MNWSAIFPLFGSKKREFIPVVYYPAELPPIHRASERHFPPDIAEAIVRMAQHLSEIEAISEQEIIRFQIPEMLRYLAKINALTGIGDLRIVNVAGVVFGKEYAALYYEDEQENCHYLPQQLIFYHEQKPTNYYLSIREDGLEWKENGIAASNSTNIERSIAKTRPISLDFARMQELKMAFHVLFIFLKFQIVAAAEKHGYNDFIRRFATMFGQGGEKRDFLSGYLTHYFSLNTEKKDLYPLVYSDFDFPGLVDALICREGIGLSPEGVSFAELYNWVEQRTGAVLPRKYYPTLYDLLVGLKEPLRTRGYMLCVSKGQSFSSTTLLLADYDSLFSSLNIKGIEIVCFGEEIYEQYREAFEYERETRWVAEAFYRLLGVADLNTYLLRKEGGYILTEQLYEDDYLIMFDWKEDEISDTFSLLLQRYGLGGWLQTQAVDGLLLDERYFGEDSDVSSYDRMILYARPLSEQGKLLFYLNTDSDDYSFGLIEDTPEARMWLDRLASQMIQLNEIIDYTLFTGEEQPLFSELLTCVDWTFDQRPLSSMSELLRKVQQLNQEGQKSVAYWQEYLAREVLSRSEVVFCCRQGEEESTLSLRADNGRSFSNGELLYKIHNALSVDPQVFARTSEVEFVSIYFSQYRKGYVLCLRASEE